MTTNTSKMCTFVLCNYYNDLLRMEYTIIYLGNDVATHKRLQANTMQKIIRETSIDACRLGEKELALLLVEIENFAHIVNHENFSAYFSVAVVPHVDENQSIDLEQFNDILWCDASDSVMRMRFNLYENAIFAENTKRCNRNEHKEISLQNNQIKYDEALFRSIIESVPNGLIVFKDGIITNINGNVLAALGGKVTDYLNKKVSQLVIPSQKAKFETFVAGQIQNSTNENKQFTFLSINNEEIFVKLSCKSLAFSGEHLISFQDISELIKSKELIVRQEYSLSEIQTMAKIGHYEVDFKLQTIYWSREMYDIYDADPLTFTPRLYRIWRHVYPHDLQALKECYRRVKTQQGVHEITYRLEFGTKEKWVYERLYGVFDENGEVQQVVGWAHDISDLIATKNTLTLTQKKYTYLFQNLKIAFLSCSVEKDSNGNPIDYIIREMNPACGVLWESMNVDYHTLLNKSLRNAVVLANFWIQKCDEVYATNQTVQFETYTEVFKKTLRSTLFASPDKSQLFAFLEDITGQVNIKNTLTLTENKYAQLFENLDMGFLACSIEKDSNNQPIDYIIREINPACEKIWQGNGVDFKTILNKSLSEAIVASDFWIQACNKVYESNQTMQFTNYEEVFNKTLKATVFMTLDKTQIFGLVEDVTEQELVAQTTLQLTARLQRIQNYARIGTMVTDIHGNYQWNNVMYQLFEYNTNMQPSLEIYMDRVHPEERDFTQNLYFSAIENGEKFVTAETRLQFGDGRIKYLYTEFENFYENKEWVRTEGWMQDITTHREFELQLIYAREKAEEGTRLKSSFLANMSHEIRTPLNAIVGFSNLLARKNYSEEKRRLFLNDIQNNSKQLLAIINDILDISKIESEQLKLSYIWIDLNQLMQEVHDTMQVQIKNKNVSLFCQKSLPDSKVRIYMDDVRLKQILTNLLSNAIKFTEQGFVNFGYVLKDEDTLEFFVKDTGVGIAPEKQASVFESFRQEDETTTRKFGGTGLGLAISRRLVELMGGKIWLESEKDKGAQFFFDVPYVTEKIETAENAASKNGENNSEEELAAMLDGEKIVVVDDHDSAHVLISEFFADYNVSVQYFSSGREAINYMEENHPVSLIFMDIHMPDLNGLETMKILKSQYPKIPIIAQTAFALKEDKLKYLSAGFDDYVAKPITHDELVRVSTRFLGE